MNRALSPDTNVTGIGAAIAAIYAAVVMIIHFAHHDGIIDPQVIVSAVTAAAFLYTRFKVTPVSDPKDGAGRPLVPAPTTTGVTVNVAAGNPGDAGKAVVKAIQDYGKKLPPPDAGAHP